MFIPRAEDVRFDVHMLNNTSPLTSILGSIFGKFPAVEEFELTFEECFADPKFPSGLLSTLRSITQSHWHLVEFAKFISRFIFLGPWPLSFAAQAPAEATRSQAYMRQLYRGDLGEGCSIPMT